MALNSTPRRRFGVALGVVLTGVAAGLIGFAGTASAHTPKINAKCDEKTATTTLSVKLASYVANSKKTNTVKITDGETVLDEADFRENYEDTFEVPGNVAHSFKVVVKAWDDPDGSKGWSFTRPLETLACVTKPPSSEPSTPPSSEPSTPPSSQPSTPPSSQPSTPPSSTSVAPTTTVAVAPPVTSTTRPTPKPAAAETGALAETGASIALPLGIAGVLLVGGGVLLFVVRRRSKA